jgi:hypothetical protein
MEIEKYPTQFGYRALLNVPTERDVDPTDANAITYKDPVNMAETWNKINNKLIAKNANEVWGALAIGRFPLLNKSKIYLLHAAKLEPQLPLLSLVKRSSWSCVAMLEERYAIEVLKRRIKR